MIPELENLPEVSFIDNITLDDIQKQLVSDYEQRYETLTGKPCVLRKADPIALTLYACSVLLFQTLLYVDRAGKQDLLKYSYGGYMDNLAAIRGITRLEAKAAVTTVRFTLSQEMTEVIAIPKGTRTTNGEIYFQTDEYAEIPKGQTYVDVHSTCQTKGIIGNDIPQGGIGILVDMLPYIKSVSNTEITSGGADIESDENLAERIYLAPSGYSVAGPDDAYEYHTMAYNQDIIDVKVSSPAPTEVEIRFLIGEGEIPTGTVIKGLEEYLQDNNIRPLTDKVKVLAPEQEQFSISLSYYINRSDSAKANSIQSAVNAAIDDYVRWQTYSIGRDINPSELTKRVVEAGAKRVEVTSPVFTTVPDHRHPSAEYGKKCGNAVRQLRTTETGTENHGTGRPDKNSRHD